MDYIIQVCFQWKGITEGLKEHYELVKKVCAEKEGVKFMGLYGPLNERWNWVYMYKAESWEKYWEADRKFLSELSGGRPKQATNLIYRMYRKFEPE